MIKRLQSKLSKKINYSSYNGKTLLLKEPVNLSHGILLPVGTPIKILGVNYVYVSAQVKIYNKIQKVCLDHKSIDWNI